MKKIAVISDTHLSGPNPFFVGIFERYLLPADLLLHCGDMAGYGMLSFLKEHPNFHAAAGNMDSYDIAAEVPARLELDFAGLRIGAIHTGGWGGDPAEKALRALGPGFGLICHGHTHIFDLKTINGTKILNPGSLCSPRKGGPSLALVEYSPDSGEIRVERIDLEGKVC